MSGRIRGRLLVLLLGLLRRSKRQRFDPHRQYHRILIVHHLLLGDTILLTPLLAKLRQRYPGAEISMTVSPPFASLYANHPYGITVHPYHPRDFSSLLDLLRTGGFDLALVPGDIRYTWLARALGARCIVAFPKDKTSWKSWQIDHQAEWPMEPCTLADIFTTLVDGPPPPFFSTEQWPIAPAQLTLPVKPYCVLHVSARNPLRRWPASSWINVAKNLRSCGVGIVWSGGPGDDELFKQLHVAPEDTCYPGVLNLLQLREVISEANLLITVETGIAHLCRTTGTPSVVIYGQGTPVLHGNESFWRDASPMLPAFVEEISCRDQTHVFGRRLPWVRRCDRSKKACEHPICIERLAPDVILKMATSLLKQS
jgi:ADP-heptose:LPS heptosyltransferase